MKGQYGDTEEEDKIKWYAALEQVLCSSWEVPQQPEPKAQDGSESPDPSLTISFMKKQTFNQNIKYKGVYLPIVMFFICIPI